MTGSLPLLFLVLWPILCAGCGFILGRHNKRWRDYFSMLTALVELLVAMTMLVFVARGETPVFAWPGFCGLGLTLKLGGLQAVYAVVASFMWFLTLVMSREYFHHYRNRNRYHFFTLFTLGATVGVFLAADLFTTFIFFEMMSMTSFVMVINNEKPASIEAAKLYLFVALACGLVLLMGIQMLQNLTGTVNFDALYQLCSHMEDKSTLFLPALLMLVGFGAKAGMFPLHIWLPEAHPVAPAPASALLSGVLTKSGVFGILALTTNLFYHDGQWGQLTLVLGTITMALGAILAVFTMDLKRVLACSSVSQIGFILVGTGMQGLLGHHNALAVRGTLLHMVNHSLIKLVLFMAAGAVYMNIHELDINGIRGFGRGKPLLHGAFLSGALSIMGVPLFSGYISKTLLHESIVEYIHYLEELGQHPIFYQAIEGIFIITGGLTFAYILKIYLAIFWERNLDPARQMYFESYNVTYLRKKGKFALIAAGSVLPVLGLLPYQTMDRLADLGQSFMHGEAPEHVVDYFAWINLKGALYSIAIGLAVYFLVIRLALMSGIQPKEGSGGRRYCNRWPAWLDLNQRVYRPLFLRLLPAAGHSLARACFQLSAQGFDLILSKFIVVGESSARGAYTLAANTFDLMLAAVLVAGTGLAQFLQGVSAGGFNSWLALGLTLGVALARIVYGISQHSFEDGLIQGDRLIHRVFSFIDRTVAGFYRALDRQVDHHDEFVFGAVPKERKREYEMWRTINSSLSYSLLLFGVGLLIAMVFLLMRR